jgi:hypothetical protein
MGFCEAQPPQSHVRGQSWATARNPTANRPDALRTRAGDIPAATFKPKF